MSTQLFVSMRTAAARPARVVVVSSALALVMAAACGVDVGVSPDEPAVGPGVVYILTSTNDVILPAVFAFEGTETEVRQGALSLAPDSSYVFSIALRTRRNGGQWLNSTSTFRGDYRRTGDGLALRQGSPQSDTLFLGTYAPTSVSVQRVKADVAGDRFVFAR